MTNTRIPGLSFSLKRALGITRAKQQFARKTGIPTSKAGLERKIGRTLLKAIFGKWNLFWIDNLHQVVKVTLQHYQSSFYPSMFHYCW